MKTLNALCKFGLAAFVLVAMFSCAKEDVAVQANNQLEFRGPSLGSQFEELNVTSDVTLVVNRGGSTGTTGNPTGGSVYELSGRGQGQSPEYGECETFLKLDVDVETAYATGYVVYSFSGHGMKIRFDLSGEISRDPANPVSELYSVLASPGGFGSSDRPTGRGTTMLVGDIFNQMQHINMFPISMRTNAFVDL